MKRRASKASKLASSTVRRSHKRSPSITLPGRGEADVTAIIAETSNCATAIDSLALAQQRKSEAVTRWARHERNPALRDLFAKFADLQRVRVELVRSLQTAETQFGEVFGWVQLQEKEIEDLRRDEDRESMNVARLLKSVNEMASDPKSKQSKMAQMEAELEKAESEFRSCTKRLTGAKRGFEYAKVTAIKTGMRAYATSSASVLTKEQRILTAVKDLAAEVPKEPIQLAEDTEPYADCGKRSDAIVAEAIEAVNMEVLFLDDEQADMHAARVLRGRRSTSGAADAFDVLTMEGQLVDEVVEKDCIFEDDFPEIPRIGEPLLGSVTIRERAAAMHGVPGRRGRLSSPGMSATSSRSGSLTSPLSLSAPPISPRETLVEKPPGPSDGNSVLNSSGGAIATIHAVDLGYADIDPMGGDGTDADDWVVPPPLYRKSGARGSGRRGGNKPDSDHQSTGVHDTDDVSETVRGEGSPDISAPPTLLGDGDGVGVGTPSPRASPLSGATSIRPGSAGSAGSSSAHHHAPPRSASPPVPPKPKHILAERRASWASSDGGGGGDGRVTPPAVVPRSRSSGSDGSHGGGPTGSGHPLPVVGQGNVAQAPPPVPSNPKPERPLSGKFGASSSTSSDRPGSGSGSRSGKIGSDTPERPRRPVRPADVSVKAVRPASRPAPTRTGSSSPLASPRVSPKQSPAAATTTTTSPSVLLAQPLVSSSPATPTAAAVGRKIHSYHSATAPLTSLSGDVVVEEGAARSAGSATSTRTDTRNHTTAGVTEESGGTDSDATGAN
eukprot:m.70764 g.70764  ORF g.70764 m.70764 type:complete len:783 (+) comp8665_c1_seq1:558-2906(+)